MAEFQTIRIHALAPPKPAYGAKCNGCGLCCLAATCPVARLFLGQFKGPCRALVWDDVQKRYLCGLVLSPEKFIPLLPASWSFKTGQWLAGRIAAGDGCDSDAEELKECS